MCFNTCITPLIRLKTFLSNVDENDSVRNNLFTFFFYKQSTVDVSLAVLPFLDNNSLPTELLSFLVLAEVDALVLTEEDVKKILLHLGTSKAYGPDLINLINPRLLIEAAFILCYPLIKLFKKSLSTSYFAVLWKIADFIHLFIKKEAPMTSPYIVQSLSLHYWQTF